MNNTISYIDTYIIWDNAREMTSESIECFDWLTDTSPTLQRITDTADPEVLETTIRNALAARLRVNVVVDHDGNPVVWRLAEIARRIRPDGENIYYHALNCDPLAIAEQIARPGSHTIERWKAAVAKRPLNVSDECYAPQLLRAYGEAFGRWVERLPHEEIESLQPPSPLERKDFTILHRQADVIVLGLRGAPFGQIIAEKSVRSRWLLRTVGALSPEDINASDILDAISREDKGHDAALVSLANGVQDATSMHIDATLTTKQDGRRALTAKTAGASGRVIALFAEHGSHPTAFIRCDPDQRGHTHGTVRGLTDDRYLIKSLRGGWSALPGVRPAHTAPTFRAAAAPNEPSLPASTKRQFRIEDLRIDVTLEQNYGGLTRLRLSSYNSELQDVTVDVSFVNDNGIPVAGPYSMRFVASSLRDEEPFFTVRKEIAPLPHDAVALVYTCDE